MFLMLPLFLVRKFLKETRIFLKLRAVIAQWLKSLGSSIRPEFDLPLSKLLLIPQFPQLSKGGNNNTCLIG